MAHKDEIEKDVMDAVYDMLCQKHFDEEDAQYFVDSLEFQLPGVISSTLRFEKQRRAENKEEDDDSADD